MFKRILVPLDGSLLAEQVLPLVQAIAEPLHSAVELLTVIAPGTLYDERLGKEQVFHNALAKIAGELEAHHIRTTYKVVEGDPAQEIISEAERAPDTIIAMSTHGRSGVGRWALGSVADRVARHATAPALIVHPQTSYVAAPRLATAIAPVDGSELAEQALPVARELAKALSLSLVLVRAVPLPVLISDAQYGAALGNYYQDVLDMNQQQAEEYMDRATAAQKAAGIENVNGIVSIGSPTRVILDVISEMPGSITIMTSHGRSGPSRWVLGSVADHIIRASDRPVLLVHSGEQQDT
ncbi:MAG: universal stress protein [Chloroflexi bacterium]|nr:universal stress protein [Chloroflexota bacterium]